MDWKMKRKQKANDVMGSWRTLLHMQQRAVGGRHGWHLESMA